MEQILSVPAPWGMAAALGIITLVPQENKPRCFGPVIIEQVPAQCKSTFYTAFTQIQRRARKLGMGWGTLGFLSLPFKHGNVGAAVVWAVRDFHVGQDWDKPSLHRGCLQLDGRWGWDLKQPARILEAA
jgi:hypothetical protein